MRLLIVVALGGNALSPPRGSQSFATERDAIARAGHELAGLADGGARLLVVQGNGPQVGRLLSVPGLGDPDQLDVHVAQTQGELGYLLVEALESRLGEGTCAALVTRVLVTEEDPAFSRPEKPVGAVLRDRPAHVPSAPTPGGGGWRRVVASPRPTEVLERAAIAALLTSHHVVAGGGGGVPIARSNGCRRPVPAVVDKDWVA
jgi:carbamate kinase